MRGPDSASPPQRVTRAHKSSASNKAKRYERNLNHILRLAVCAEKLALLRAVSGVCQQLIRERLELTKSHCIRTAWHPCHLSNHVSDTRSTGSSVSTRACAYQPNSTASPPPAKYNRPISGSHTVSPATPQLNRLIVTLEKLNEIVGITRMSGLYFLFLTSD